MDYLLPAPLTRSHKVSCYTCGGKTHTDDYRRPSTLCLYCMYNVTKIQSFVRGRTTRHKYNTKRQKEMAQRWFVTNGVNGSDFTPIIYSFLK
jgi:transcription initiation factor TFIIIB Brf1 subunit/transcription initiation factor TFIIB